MAIERKKNEYTPYTESGNVSAVGTQKTKAENAYSNYARAGYTMSGDVKNAFANKTNAENALANYGDFSYGNQAMLDDVMSKILNREKFSYDLNGDALYQQYKDMYVNQGKMASADVMGQAAAMTGGYGNSYSASVGNQAYQASLQQLNNVVPQLYQMALDQYNQEGQNLYSQYGLLSDDRSTQYGMWGDKRNMLSADRSYYSTEADNAFARDYGMWADKGNMLNNDRTYYGTEYNNAYARDYAEHTTKEGYKYQNVADANAFEQWKAQVGAQTDNKGNTYIPPSAPTLNASEYNEVLLNAADYAENGKASLKNYLNGMVSRGLSQDEAADIFEQYFPEEKPKVPTPKTYKGKFTEDTIN